MAKRAIDFAVGAMFTLPNNGGAERHQQAVTRLTHLVAGQLHKHIHDNVTIEDVKKPQHPAGETDYRINLLVFTPQELAEFLDERCAAHHEAQMRCIVNMVLKVSNLPPLTSTLPQLPPKGSEP